MHRLPEPELMDDAAQAQAYAAADFSEPNALFVNFYRSRFGALPFEGYVVDLGCGPADILMRFARAYRACRLHGVDGSGPMLHIARERVLEASLSERIDLFQCTLPQICLPRSGYDAVISNSLLHHLADPQSLWTAIKRLSAIDAPILVMDLVRPPGHPEVARLMRAYAADVPAILARDFKRSLLAAYTVDEVIEQIAVVELDYLDVQVVSDRHFVVAGRYRG
ncbi:MAG: class I SAM-dependent methyltransferase [Gammaproteobacteria bacterium]